MGGPEQQFEHRHQRAAGAGLSFRTGALVPEQGLGQFQVPVAVLVPGELVDGVGVQVEPAGIHRQAAVFDETPCARQDPAVGQAGFGRTVQGMFPDVHQDEPGGVPQFVAEVAVAFRAAQVEAHVAAGGGQRAERKTQGVRAERRNPLREVPAGVLLDAGRHLRLGKVVRAFGSPGPRARCRR